jgi:hypothetical protein
MDSNPAEASTMGWTPWLIMPASHPGCYQQFGLQEAEYLPFLV